MITRKHLILAAVALVLIGAVAATGLIYLGRAAMPEIRLANRSGEVLEGVAITMSANGVTWTEQVDKLDPGEEVLFKRRTSDLNVITVEYRRAGQQHRWQAGGIATTGETLLFQVGNGAGVSVSYERTAFTANDR
jgi:hypothetical protein